MAVTPTFRLLDVTLSEMVSRAVADYQAEHGYLPSRVRIPATLRERHTGGDVIDNLPVIWDDSASEISVSG